MKTVKFLALAVSTIALFPAASFADNLTGTEQEVNVKSVTVGSGNVNIKDIKQQSLDYQQSTGHNANVTGTTMKVNADTTTVGNGNLDVTKVVQEALNGKTTK